MTLHVHKKPGVGKKLSGKPRKDVPLTFGHVFGDAIRKTLSDRARRAELDAAGFKPLKGAP